MSLIGSKRVPNIYNRNSPILIVGEAPGNTEVDEGKPFVGQSGELLTTILEQLRVDRNNISLTNLCQFRPHDNKFEFLEDSDELRSGVQELKSFIQEQRSMLRIIILLGERPLQYICERYGISKWRGSVIENGGLCYLPTYHPAFVLRDRTVYPIFTFDLSKALKVANEGYTRPTDNFTIDPRGLDLEECIHEIINNKVVSCDIESKKDSSYIRCVGFGLSNSRAICLANHTYDGLDLSLYNALNRIFSANLNLVFHNNLFDVPMLGLNGVEADISYFDTMVAQHILEPEMPRNLAYLTSLYTDRPYYKGMVKDDDEKGWNDKVSKETLHEYNCIDCVATYEVYSKQLIELREERLFDFFRYEMELCEVARHFSDTGMLVDEDRLMELDKILKTRWAEDQELLNNIVGYEVNVKSPKLKDTLYTEMKLPVRKSYTGTITTDEDAIVSLLSYTKDYISTLRTDDKKLEWTKKLATLKLILRIREYRQILSNYINATRRPNGRLHSSVKVAATETGRWAAQGYVDGTGLNFMTMPRAIIEVD